MYENIRRIGMSILREAMWSCSASSPSCIIQLLKGAVQLSTTAVRRGVVGSVCVRRASPSIPCFPVVGKQTRVIYFRAFVTTMADNQEPIGSGGGGGEGPDVELTAKQLKKQAKKDAKKAKFEKKMEENRKQEQLSAEVVMFGLPFYEWL